MRIAAASCSACEIFSAACVAFALEPGLVGRELGLDPQARLLGIVLGLREDRLCLDLKVLAAVEDLLAGGLEEPVALDAGVADDQARLLLGDAQDLFELRAGLRLRASVDELFGERLRALLSRGDLRVRRRELGLESLHDLAAALLGSVGGTLDLRLGLGGAGLRCRELCPEPCRGVAATGFGCRHPRVLLGLEPLHRLAAVRVRGIAHALVALLEEVDLVAVRAQACRQAGDRRVDLVPVVAAERRRERGAFG